MKFFGKKKDNGVDDLKKVLGEEPKTNEKPTRKEAKQALKKQYDIEAQKGEIIELLKKSFAKVNSTQYYEESDRIMALMTHLKTGAVDQNARAVYALDGLIKKYVVELEVYCNQGNLYGIRNSIDAIDTLINQRGYVTHKYYEDPKYLSAKIELMKLQVNREYNTVEINKKIDTFNSLKASAAGESEAKRMQIQKQMTQIKLEKDGLQKQADAMDVQIGSLTTLVLQKEQNKDVYLPGEIVNEFGEVLEETQETDAQIAQVSKQAEKIAGASKTVMNQGMTVSDADTEKQESSVDIENMTI